KNTINHSLGECHPRLIIRWKENELSLFISYNFFINTEDINVTTRMGSLPAVVNLWSVSSDYEAIFYKGTNFQCADFIKQMSNHKSFVIRFTPYGQSPFISEFNTEGIDEVIYEIGSYLNN
ncbi:MAG: hypothetical protein M0R32_09045, partial [Candidatus Cloacimonetes bacterium]|nr:hypothetical protein [Candidatus Cloacimonadota bacterium]